MTRNIDGLVKAGASLRLFIWIGNPWYVKITAKGLDFINDPSL
jgi:hypothetical protein